MRKYRIYLLRLLFAWWYIPSAWIIVGLLLYLLEGDTEAMRMITKAAWNGIDE